jgi:chemotaxis protein methyltransferase CheR
MSETVARPMPGTADDRFSPRNFARLTELIHTYSGIKMPASKRTMLAVRLRSRLAALQVGDLDSYCQYLFEDGGMDSELVHLINAVSTNKTDFFREPAHFDFLRDTALPELAASGRRDVKLWSAAASIGAEAYTMAMVLEDFRTRHHGPDYSILATDISTEVLALAVLGQFAAAMVEPVPAEIRNRYVLQSRDPALGLVRIIPALRAKIAWARLNLMDDNYAAGHDMDVIFCRNVLIYFDKTSQANVLLRLCDHLRPGGYLILGHSETAAGVNLPVIPIFNTIFRKV